MNLYNKLSCNSRGIHTVFNWLIHWFESACMMVLYKRQQHKASQTTSHTFYYTYSTPKWNSMHPTAITVLVHARYMHADLHKNQGWQKYKTRRYGYNKRYACACETLQAERTWLVARRGRVGIYDDNYKHNTDLLDRSPPYECRGAIVPTQWFLHSRCRPLRVELAAGGTTLFCVVFHGRSLG